MDNYAAWAQQYYDEATKINEHIDKLRERQSKALTPEQKHELSVKIIAYEEIHYDLITSYQALKERSENLHKERTSDGTKEYFKKC